MTGLEIFLLVFLCGALVCVINLAREVRDLLWFIKKMFIHRNILLDISRAARGLQACFKEEVGRQQACVVQGFDPSQDEELCQLKRQSTLCKKNFWKLVRLAKECGLVYESWASAEKKQKKYSDFINPEDISPKVYLG